MKKKILIVFGTRPEAIKMAPLVKEFLKQSNSFETKVCVRAQHREMLDQVLNLFEITPEYDLDIMKPGQDLYDVTSNVLLGMKSVLSDFKPDVLFVHGDTSTTFAASLAAFYQQISVAHIEAGLRTGDRYSPWPEEANRQLTTQITTYHFAPTATSKANLLKENVNERSIEVTGNTVIDALFLALEKIKNAALKFENGNGQKAKVACMGLAFKPDIDDLRESPALYITRRLIADGLDVLAIEPNVENFTEFNIVNYKDALAQADVITFLVAHREFKGLDIYTELDFCGVLNG